MLRAKIYYMEVVERVLCVKLNGVWTTSNVKAVFADCQRQVADIKHQPWAAYIYPSNLKMQDSVGIKSVLDKANA